MLIANEGALAELKRFGAAVAAFPRPAAGAVREALCRVGRFVPVAPREPERAVVAVDGSCQTIGTTYPCFLALIQAVALPLPPVGEPAVGHRLFSPLLPEERAVLEAAGGAQPAETAAELRVKALMAELELTVALEAAGRVRGALTLLDGGFVHFRARAAAPFARLTEAVAAGAGVLIGVIEEVSSRLLGEAVGDLWPAGHCPYDREILYGCLEVGEAFVVGPGLSKGEGTGTVFARFGAHPQPVAFDFLRVQEEAVLAALGMLRALTPGDGRGVPAPVDLADRYVRLTAAEVEQLVAAAVPAALRELLLTAHRTRRAL